MEDTLFVRGVMVESLLMRLPRLGALPDRDDRVETASRADEDGLADLLTRAFAETWDRDRVRRDLLDDPTVSTTFVVRDGPRLVATASARLSPDHPGSGYLHWVGSDPEVRGLGLGRAVTVAVLHDFVADGFADAVLETDDERLAAIDVYLALGFIPVYRDESHQHRWSAIFPALAGRAQQRRAALRLAAPAPVTTGTTLLAESGR